MNLAPIAFFSYNRPEHTKIALDSLKKNKLSKNTIIYLFVDGPKNKKDLEKIFQIKKIYKNLKGFKKKFYIFNKKNLGLSKSFISGISLTLKKHKKIIVLEDDNKVSKFYLNYMNDGLSIYEKEKKVCSISGYSYPIKYSNNLKTFFLKGADTWGWGTWRRSWKDFDKNGRRLLSKIKSSGLEYDFNFFGSIDLTKMLEDQIKNKNDSYTVRWMAYNYLNKRFILYPTKSFVQNIGNEGSGHHGLNSKIYNVKIAKSYDKIKKIDITENLLFKIKIANYFFSHSRYSNFIKFYKFYKWLSYKFWI